MRFCIGHNVNAERATLTWQRRGIDQQCGCYALAIAIMQQMVMMQATVVMQASDNHKETIMWRRAYRITVLFLAIGFAVTAQAEFGSDLHALQQEWAAARYQLKDSDQQKRLRVLIVDADALVQKNSDSADAYLWAAIVRGSLAESVNGLSALGIAKEARANLEKSLALDPTAEEAYAYAVLGMLYAKVPGWPIAFGDNKKARELLQKGLALSPNGMNINYFNAKFFAEQKDYRQALNYAERAAQAQPPYPPEQSLGVQNRQREIRELIDELHKKLN